MTEMPASTNLELQLERAASALESARVLLGAKQYSDAISPAYLSTFHAACALLGSIGRAARTHDGVRAMVAEHFIRPGVLAREYGRALSRIAGDRNDADYNVAAVFSDGDAREDIVLAEGFLEAVDAILKRRSAEP